MITLTPSISFGGHATDVGLSNLSNNFLYASAVVLALAMFSFAFDLAGHPGRVQRAEERKAEAEEKSAAAVAESSSGKGGTAVLERTSAETGAIPEKRQWAGIGMSLSWLGWLLLTACVFFRAASVGRPPLGNMYEFAIVGAFFVMTVFLFWSLNGFRKNQTPIYLV